MAATMHSRSGNSATPMSHSSPQYFQPTTRVQCVLSHGYCILWVSIPSTSAPFPRVWSFLNYNLRKTRPVLDRVIRKMAASQIQFLWLYQAQRIRRSTFFSSQASIGYIQSLASYQLILVS
jgi:hypothetical protein